MGISKREMGIRFHHPSIREHWKYAIVLPGLSFAILEQALMMSRSQNHTAVGIWLMKQFQG